MTTPNYQEALEALDDIWRGIGHENKHLREKAKRK